MTKLSIRGLEKAFFQRRLFENVNVDFNSGCHVITGTNGTGKTTFLEILAGVMMPDNGSIKLDNAGDNTTIAFKKMIAYVPSKPVFYPSAKGREFLNFIYSVKGFDGNQWKDNTLIADFDLEPYLDINLEKMSLGTQRKLFLSTLVIGNPSLIILDEPTNGLDKQANAVLYKTLNMLQDTIIMIATHDTLLIENLSPTIYEVKDHRINALSVNSNEIVE